MGLLPFWRLANDGRFAELPGILFELPPLEGAKRYEQDLSTLPRAGGRARAGRRQAVRADVARAKPPRGRAPQEALRGRG